MVSDELQGLLSSRFEQALIYALRLHNSQSRKGSKIPYLSHLLAVTALVLEDGGDEDMAIAALLHDAVEDQGGLKTLEEIRQRFGERVASIVEGCSDSFTAPKPPWKERKYAYLQRLRNETPEVRKVSLADKLHNARTILRDLRHQGPAILDRFSGGRKGTLWYYRTLANLFAELDNSPLAEELARVVSEIEELVSSTTSLEGDT